MKKFWAANFTLETFRQVLSAKMIQKGWKMAKIGHITRNFRQLKLLFLDYSCFFKEECLGIWCVSSSVTKQITRSGDQPFFSVVAIPLLWLATFSYLGLVKELIQRGMALVDWAPDHFDPLMVEPVNSSNPSILRGSRQEEPTATRL